MTPSALNGRDGITTPEPLLAKTGAKNGSTHAMRLNRFLESCGLSRVICFYQPALYVRMVLGR
jgi:hypothetical protein